MTDLKELLERRAAAAPPAGGDLADLARRRARRERRRRVGGGLVGAAVMVALIVGGLAVLPGDPRVAGAGGALPAATDAPPDPGVHRFAYLRFHDYACAAGACAAGDDHEWELELASWYRADGSGLVDVLRQRNWGQDEGAFGPGTFPTEGDTSAFPTDPEALEAFLFERSGPGGASPGPGEPTPAPGIDGRTGDVWRAIQDLLAGTTYLDTSPALRAALAEVAAGLPMASVEGTGVDPAGRDALIVRVDAFDAETRLFLDPGTHDLLAIVWHFGDGGTRVHVVEAAGVTDATDEVPRGADRSIPPAAG
jgi:hypothetical protein